MNKKKVKFREYMIHMLQEVRGGVRVRERWLKIVFRDRYALSRREQRKSRIREGIDQRTRREQRKRAVGYLREKRYELEVFEKQIPTPPRTYKHYSTCRICKSTHVEAYISSNRYCPSCGEIIMPSMPYLPRYCGACGQRLWWPPEGIMIGNCYYRRNE